MDAFSFVPLGEVLLLKGAQKSVVDRYLPPDERASIDAALKEAESKTTARIVPFVVTQLKDGVKNLVEEAAYDFKLLKLDEIPNSILVLLLVSVNRKAVIVFPHPDLLSKRPLEVWAGIARSASGHFGETGVNGMCFLLRRLGEFLSAPDLCPRGKNDAEIQPDHLVFRKEQN